MAVRPRLALMQEILHPEPGDQYHLVVLHHGGERIGAHFLAAGDLVHIHHEAGKIADGVLGALAPAAARLLFEADFVVGKHLGIVFGVLADVALALVGAPAATGDVADDEASVFERMQQHASGVGRSIVGGDGLVPIADGGR
jgi:hypothetical protein